MNSASEYPAISTSSKGMTPRILLKIIHKVLENSQSYTDTELEPLDPEGSWVHDNDLGICGDIVHRQPLVSLG